MRRSNGSELLVTLFASLTCCSCATIISGTHQHVTFYSSPPGATVRVEGYPEVGTPGSLELARKHPHQAMIHKDGYRDETVPIECGLNIVSLGNMVFLVFGIPGLLIDGADGAMGELKPSRVSVTLQPSSPEAPPGDGN
jgi:hypothetical protein